MTKADIIKQIARETGVEAATVLAVVEGFMEEVRAAQIRKENVFLTNLGCTHLFHKFLDNGRNGYGLDARFPGDLLYDICFSHVL